MAQNHTTGNVFFLNAGTILLNKLFNIILMSMNVKSCFDILFTECCELSVLVALALNDNSVI